MGYTSSVSENLPFLKSWQEQVIAKAKNYNIAEEEILKSTFKSLYDMIRAHEDELVELARRTCGISFPFPSFEEKTWEQQSIAKAQELIIKLYNKVQNFSEESPWQLEIREKADKYNISYNRRETNWLKLSETIDRIEELAKLAETYGISNIDYNDPIDLEQRIEEASRREIKYKMDIRNDYCSSR